MVGRTHRDPLMAATEVRAMIYDNLLKLKDELKGKPEERPRLRRVTSILMRRYNYGIESVEDRMEQYRYGDFRDDIAAVKR